MEKLWSCGLTESINIVSDIELHCQSANDQMLSLVTAVHFADSLSEHHRYAEAVGHYQMALRQMKSASTLRQISGQMEEKGLTEMDVRMKLALCQCRMKNYQFALETLEEIVQHPKGSCPVKAIAFAASLHHKLGQNRVAAKYYKDVVRQCPLALEAINGLLQIGVKSFEIFSLIPGDIRSQHFWLPVWIKAGELLEQCQFAGAVTVLQSLPEKSFESPELLARLAYSQWMAGSLDSAKRSFQKARSLNPHIIHHMDSYAHLLFICENKQELENVATSLQQSSQDYCESWIALSYLSYSMDKKTRALYFSEKAASLNDTNVEGIILKGFLLHKFTKPQQAIVQYREAVRLSPGHFYANEGLVQCLLDCQRYRSAELVAQSMLKAVGQTARAFMVVLCAISHTHDDQANKKKVHQALTKALSLDATLSQAHLMLSEYYRNNDEYDKAIESLEIGISQTDINASLSFHVALADLLQLVGRTADAMEHYNAALRLDADCIQAHVGLQQMETTSGDAEQAPSVDFMGEDELDQSESS